MVNGVLMLVLNPFNPVSVSVDSCEQVYIRIILRNLWRSLHLAQPSMTRFLRQLKSQLFAQNMQPNLCVSNLKWHVR